MFCGWNLALGRGANAGVGVNIGVGTGEENVVDMGVGDFIALAPFACGVASDEYLPPEDDGVSS